MPEEVKTEDIYGIWSCTLPDGGELTYRFNKNNLYVMTDASGESGKGHYTVTDNKVCMFPEKGAGYIDCEIKKLKDGSMTLHDDIYGDIGFTCTGGVD